MFALVSRHLWHSSAGLQIVRALVAINDDSSKSFVQHLFDILNDQEVALDAARAIGKVPSSDGVLTKQNNAQLRVSSHFI